MKLGASDINTRYETKQNNSFDPDIICNNKSLTINMDSNFTGLKTVDTKLARYLTKKDGFFVEVGCGDGVINNNTLYFENIGWTGVLIESVITQCAKCKINRPKAVVLNHECKSLSCLNDDLVNNSGCEKKLSSVFLGTARTLNVILDDLEVDEIDLLVINVKDKGEEVLKGLDLCLVRPEYILIEEPLVGEIRSYLAKHFYEPIEEYSRNAFTRSVLYLAIKKELKPSFVKVVPEHLKISLLNKAWEIAAKSNASFPGRSIAYYSLKETGIDLPGERPWEDRWNYIGKALQSLCNGTVANKKILDLGCNLGLLSVWAAREGANCHGYEYEADILSGCKLIAAAFDVDGKCRWTQADLNDENVIESIGNGYDVCACLSVMQWVKNKDNLIKLLSKQKAVIYEGHEHEEIELSRLQKAGFEYIEKIATSERMRSVFIAKKTDAITDKILDILSISDGFFVEVGAGDGIGISKTRYLEKTGWQGILIEADIEKCANCIVNRPNSAVLNYHCTDFDKSLSKSDDSYDSDKSGNKLDFRQGKGRTNILTEIFDELEINEVDLLILNIDKDAWEVLQGVDFHRFKPKYILLAQNLEENEIKTYLNRLSYDHIEDIIDSSGNTVFLFKYITNVNDDISHALSSKYPKQKLLERAWEIAHQKGDALYSINVDGKHFPGKNLWEEKSKHIIKALKKACGGNLMGKILLVMGCEMGLLEAWVSKQGAVCHVYDNKSFDEAILISKAFGVSERNTWYQIDFNNTDQIDNINGMFHACLYVSLANKIKNRQSLFNLFVKQKAVVYKSQDTDEIEIDFLKQAGFAMIDKIPSFEADYDIWVASKEKICKDINPYIYHDYTEKWNEFEKQFGLTGQLYHIPLAIRGDGISIERTYILSDEILKVRLSVTPNPYKLNSPEQEAKILQRLKDVSNVSRFKKYIKQSNLTILIIERFQNIGILAKVPLSAKIKIKVERQKHTIINAVNSCGVLHNDFNDSNFLINSRGDICLIDFDQAELMQGKNDYDHGKFSKIPRPISFTLNEENRKLLERAWNIAAKSDISAPGHNIAYYSFSIDGTFFPGERLWMKRWILVRKGLQTALKSPLKGKRILELNCNMGLISTFAAMEGANCHGYADHTDILESCNLIAEAFNVSDKCIFKYADFNNKNDTDKITSSYDICVCLSLMNWMKNKDDLIELLSRQNMVLYDGHDSDKVEIDRLVKAGFTKFSKIDICDRFRTLYLAEKIDMDDIDSTETCFLQENMQIEKQEISENPGGYPRKHDSISVQEKIRLSKFMIKKDTVYAWRNLRMLSMIDPLLKSFPETTWMTVGDGYWGRSAHYLENKGFNTLATDIDASLLAQAKKEKYINKFRKENVLTLSCEDNEFDFILCRETMHHLPKPFTALYEMIRVAKKGIVLIEPFDAGINSWERVGNFIFGLSARDIEKTASGLGIGEIAFKRFNSGFHKLGIFEKADEKADIFDYTKEKLTNDNAACKSGQIPYNFMVSIIFKQSPPLAARNTLSDNGFIMKDLLTPHICPACKIITHCKRKGQFKCNCGFPLKYNGYTVEKFNKNGSYSILDNAMDLIELSKAGF